MTTGGIKHNQGKPRMSLLPMRALRAVAAVMSKAEGKKYRSHNWRGGRPWSEWEDAMLRHYGDYQEGIDIDPEFDESHLAHMCCCALFLLEHYLRGYGRDDRYCREMEEEK